MIKVGKMTLEKNSSNHANQKRWPSPKAFGVGLFTDLRLYGEALIIADLKGGLNVELLKTELPQRVKGLVLVEGFKKTAYQGLIRELTRYDFVQKTHSNSYVITDEGRSFKDLFINDRHASYDILLRKMQDTYVIPSWFVNRIWELNRSGKGQIVIPAPIKDWKCSPKKWKDYLWFDELENVCCETYRKINTAICDVFPMDYSQWIHEIKIEYERQGTLSPRKQIPETEINNIYFNPRNRLSRAMKEVSVRYLFNRHNPNTNEEEFSNSRAQITHRSFMVWCPRLEEFGLLFYTDYKPEIPGRLIFPTSAFKKHGTYDNYEEKSYMLNLHNERLFLHVPLWQSFKQLFVDSVWSTYEYFYNQQLILYISLQDLRDEVCRQLRINSKTFESFLQQMYLESLKKEIPYSISLETDLREDMKIQINRRGVYINNSLYTLIAIKYNDYE